MRRGAISLVAWLQVSFLPIPYLATNVPLRLEAAAAMPPFVDARQEKLGTLQGILVLHAFYPFQQSRLILYQSIDIIHVLNFTYLDIYHLPIYYSIYLNSSALVSFNFSIALS
ncbi:hypothetical protein F5X96DRAFT_651786 [Biscogniauxia mediterranea]|nr:hypothetical protein F5X96DRAFT_651786 [Biscogniauxia mediterranea]